MMKALEWQNRLGSKVKRVYDAEYQRLDNTLRRINWVDWSQGKAKIELERNHLEHVKREARSDVEGTKEGTFHEAVRVLLRNPYWQRVWIVQEIVMAKRVQVMSRKFTLPFEELLAPFHTLRELCKKASDVWGVVASMWEIWDIRASGGRYPLWRLVRDFGSRETSRPADRIYGFLGMVADPDDGASSVRNITVDYAKPTVHVLLDAIFESSPPLSHYGQATRSLLPGPLKNCNSLKKYIKSSRTSQRHADFAKLALKVFEAVKAVGAVLEAIGENDVEQATLNLFQNDDWKPTLNQSAAIMGLVFFGHSNKVRRRPQGQSRLEAPSPSPWRCAAHMQRGSHEQIRLRTSGSVADLHSEWYSWDTRHTVTICGENSDSCDFSTTMMDIPDIGFRLLLETDMNGCRQARWRLQLEKIEPKELVEGK